MIMSRSAATSARFCWCRKSTTSFGPDRSAGYGVLERAMPLRILLAALLCASTQADAQISRQAAAKVKRVVII